ncbi:hypothetical protein GGQ04_001351 [Salinibacter ruber]|nr:hypothetical protein [Salinibacter ruber]
MENKSASFGLLVTHIENFYSLWYFTSRLNFSGEAPILPAVG